MRQAKPTLSVVVPVYNEAAGIELFHKSLLATLKDAPLDYEIIYINDGSHDDSASHLSTFHTQNSRVRVITFSRNFGKEIATTAGLHAATGDATIMLDADGQFPVELLPKFVAKWQQGAKVVVGLSRNRRKASVLKNAGSKLFYGLYGKLTGIRVNPNATDFRLIDRSVQTAFNRMTERNRITRGLIDWLGFEQVYITYDENPRMAGEATQSFRKLFKLAIDSAISLSTSPLYLVAYIGAIILPLSALLGIGMIIDYCLHDPLHLHATGGAYVIVLMLFLIGILMVSQGIIGLYLSHIHGETQNRPLYVIDTKKSEGV